MPDPNKIAVLKSIGYTLSLGCGECQHGRFAPGSNYGACQVNAYDHAKHGPRKLSVHRAGRCPEFTPNAKKLADVQRSGFEVFMPEGESE